ncbi:MAG TPA: SpoIVB peptidase [Clostridia bacterium]|nr:SpoIVB peptidase [Clostridia bacterium]
MRKGVGFLIIFLVIVLVYSPQFRNLNNFPTYLRITEGNEKSLTFGLPISVSVEADKEDIVNLNGQQIQVDRKINLKNPIDIVPINQGQTNLKLKLFGIIPIRNLVVDVLPEVKVVPGGQSIGVMLRTQGVIVVGQSVVEGADGKKYRPAKDAGIEVGDIILKINNVEVQNDQHVAELINEAGRKNQTLLIECKHQNQIVVREVKPIYNSNLEKYRIGLYIRDGASGIGTLSFYDPQSNKYAALGHVITDGDTNTVLEVNEGKIVKAAVSGIQQPSKGQPGEKIGVFLEEKNVLGDIDKNTNFGIYGVLKSKLDNPYYPQPIPIALQEEIKEGKAEILTVIDGQNIERFEIEIQKVNRQRYPSIKSMVIKIVDERLLAKTGGIVQGMSGSPIIQNGKLVGAVTHVFVNDPTRGYAVFAEWMVMEAGIYQQQSKSA